MLAIREYDMNEKQQNPVSAAVWPWRDAPTRANTNGSGRRWIKGFVQAAVMLVVAYVLAFRLGHRIPALLIAALAALVLVSGLAMPRLFDAFQEGVACFAHGVGVALTWILLAPFFYIVFVPARIVLALLGKDPLCLRFPTDQPTYWVPWKPPPTKEHYAKQYR